MPRAAKSKRTPPVKKPNARIARRRPTEEEIRMRAYELYLQRGSVHGYDIDDWTRAERELTDIDQE